MISNNKSGETRIANRTYYYFDGIIRINDLNSRHTK